MAGYNHFAQFIFLFTHRLFPIPGSGLIWNFSHEAEDNPFLEKDTIPSNCYSIFCRDSIAILFPFSIYSQLAGNSIILTAPN